MKILVVNCGSSSLKYQFINMDTEEVLAKGNYERIGEKESFLTHKVNEEKYVTEKTALNHEEALEVIMSELVNAEHGVIKFLNEINAVGHRVVHGGEIFDKSALINDKVISQIEECNDLAPLHNPAAVLGIRACLKKLPDVKMVAVFDTAFHQTMPKENYIYPIPSEYYTKHRVRKYGAHGTSHKYVAERAANLYGKYLENLKIVTCHIGQGASICAVKNGKSFDTSMGLTPLGGITMVTRAGDLDPSVVTYIMEKENISPRDMNNILNKKSGLAAISGLVPDFREIEAASHSNPEAEVAIKKFTSTIAGFVARYASEMYGIDGIVFTGGIGENQEDIRKAVCKHLEFMGVEIDEEANRIQSIEKEVSKPNSKVKVFVIPTNEELVIARDTLELAK